MRPEPAVVACERAFVDYALGGAAPPALGNAALYRRLVRANLVTVLENAFPVAVTVYGVGGFEALLDRFLAAGGPSTPLYRDVPGDLVAFAEGRAEPWADLLAWEWMDLCAARHPARLDALEPLAPGEVAANPTLQARLFERPVEAIAPGAPPPAPFDRPRVYLVWRQPHTDAVAFHRVGVGVAQAVVCAQQPVSERALADEGGGAALLTALSELRARGALR